MKRLLERLFGPKVPPPPILTIKTIEGHRSKNAKPALTGQERQELVNKMRAERGELPTSTLPTKTQVTINVQGDWSDPRVLSIVRAWLDRGEQP